MEGADLQQKAGKHTEVIQGFQKPYREFQKHPGNQGQCSGGGIEVAVQAGRVFYTVNGCLVLVVNVLGGIRGLQVHFNDRVRGIRPHFLFNGHAVLNVVSPGVDLLAGNEPVQPGEPAQRADVACQQHMGNAEAGQTLPPLLTDVAVDLADLDGIGEQIVRGVPGDHDVGGNLSHGGQGADSSAIGPIAPGRVILLGRMNPDGKTCENNTGQRQKIRGAVLVGFQITGQNPSAVEVQQNPHGNADHRQQEN